MRNPAVITCIEVVEATTRENSIVSGSGGGGYVSSTRAYIDPVQIATRIQRTSEVWGRQPNGQETRFLIPGADLPIRQGHKLALLVGDGTVWAVKNFSTGETNWMVDASSFSGRPRQVSTHLVATVGIATAICSYTIPHVPGWLSDFSQLYLDDWENLLLITGCMAMGVIGAFAYWVKQKCRFRKEWSACNASWETYLAECNNMLMSQNFQ